LLRKGGKKGGGGGGGGGGVELKSGIKNRFEVSRNTGVSHSSVDKKKSTLPISNRSKTKWKYFVSLLQNSYLKVWRKFNHLFLAMTGTTCGIRRKKGNFDP